MSMKIKKIEQGLNNRSFIVDNSILIRINNQETCFDRDHEIQIETFLDNNNFPKPKLLFYDTINHLKGNDLIKNYHYFNYKNDEIITIAKTLKKLHQLPIEKISNIKFNPLEKLTFFKEDQPKVIHHDQIINAISELVNEDLCLCHNDLIAENFLFTKEKLYLIDYEYAGINNYLFDLASFISENNLTEEQAQLFLNTYFNNELIPYQKLKVWINFNNLIWYYWANYKYQLTNQKIFKKIAKEKKANLQSI